jgi:hypothetical protein
MRALAWIVLLGAHVAHADSSVPGAVGAPLRCKGPFPSAVFDDETIDRQFGAGVSKVAEAIVKDEHGRLVGVLGWHRFAGSGLCFYDAPAPRWCVPKRSPDDWADAVAVAHGGRIYISSYVSATNYVDLKAYQLDGGAPLWSADLTDAMRVTKVLFRNWNQSELSIEGGHIVLTDHRLDGCFRQIFDSATGRRLSSQTSAR